MTNREREVVKGKERERERERDREKERGDLEPNMFRFVI